MAIPSISEEHILKAFQYIDKNGVPDQNKSTQYELVLQDGRKYPPKYVIGVAAKIATGREIKTDDYNSIEAKYYL